MEQIKIKIMEGVIPPTAQSFGDWIDLRCADDVEIKEGTSGIISLGVAMELPSEYEALLIPRSSTFKKYGIMMNNSIGLIDETYCGDDDYWGFPYYATKNIVIPKNTRICQFRIIKHQPAISFKIVGSLNNKSRGGFGSTGEVEIVTHNNPSTYETFNSFIHNRFNKTE